MNAGNVENHKQSQRDRILEAAAECFVRSGFHNASMANISEAAGMSPGLIYRYFDNKNAIILAIVESQLAVVQQRICDMRNREDLGDAMLDYFERYDEKGSDSVSTPLFLEISAEAVRDPDIASAVKSVDRAVRKAIAEWLHRSKEDGGYGLPADVAEERALMLILFTDGLKARKAREPDIDRRCLANAINRAAEVLITP